MTTPKERMSDPTQVKRMTDAQLEKMQASALRLWGELPIRDVAAEVIALRAAARTVEDGEVAEWINYLNGTDPLPENYDAELADLLTRLSAAKAEAERERDRAREEARKADAALSPLDDVVHHLGIEDSFTDPVEAIKQIERERDEARAALAQAREAALEEAAKVVEGQSVATNYLPDRYDVNSLAAWLSDRDFRAASSIRALKTTPTQESETP